MQWHVITSALRESWIAPQWNDLTLTNVHDVYWERWESVALGFSFSSFTFFSFFSLFPFQPSPQGDGRQKCSSRSTHFLSFNNTCRPFLPLRLLLLLCFFSLSLPAWTWLVNFKLSKSSLFTTWATRCLLAAWRSSVLDMELVWNALRVSGWNCVSLALSLPTSAAHTPFLRVFSHHVNTFFIPSNSKPLQLFSVSSIPWPAPPPFPDPLFPPDPPLPQLHPVELTLADMKSIRHLANYAELLYMLIG